MCGRYAMAMDPLFAQRLLDAPGDWPSTPRYNIAPSQLAPIVVHAGGDGSSGRVCRAMRWGLVPRWAKDESIGNRLINARSETAASKPSFRDALRRSRCLVPASGFYEWAPADGRKQPMAIRPKGDGPMVMAGLWSSWSPPDGGPDRRDPLETFTILTRSAVEQLEPIHHRMPVLLGPDAWAAWLDGALTEPAALAALMDRPVDGLVAYPVSARVNRPANDDAALLDPIDPQPESLFG